MLTRMPTLISGALLWVAAAIDFAHAQDAHVHGIGDMNVAIEGSRVDIEIEGPGDNFVGFEHAAETVEERSALGATERRLRLPATLLVLPQAAKCVLRKVDLDIPAPAAIGPGQGHSTHDHHHQEDRHGDWRARYVFACAAPAALASIRMAPWFAAFPTTRELRVQVMSSFGQSGLTLTPARSRILLRTR